MKEMLGKTLMRKKVVSQTGMELGEVWDIDFSIGGAINAVLVKPEKMLGELQEQLNAYGLLEIPYADVKAIGEYVVVDFPKH